MASIVSEHRVLDNMIWEALAGPHAALARRSGSAVRYIDEVPFFAAYCGSQQVGLRDLAELVAPGGVVALGVPLSEAVDPQWTQLGGVELIQMLCEQRVDWSGDEPPLLSASDADDMLALAELTQPGPFGRRSIEMGCFVGLRVSGELVAMAGERLHPPGYTEISAVCTRNEYRGKGLAEGLVRWVASQIQARDEVPFLHVMAGADATPLLLRWYEKMGFRERKRENLTIVQRQAEST